jgi:hypothetical protein
MSLTRQRSLARGAACVVCLLTITGCLAPRGVETEVVRVPQATTWLGKHLDDVIAVWGKPSKIKPDGEGGTLAIYEGGVVFSPPGGIVPAHSIAGTDPFYDPPPQIKVVPVGPPIEVAPEAVFYLDEDGLVYRYWFSPAVYKHGTALPPPPVGRDELDSADSRDAG